MRRRYRDAHLTYAVEPTAAPVVLGNPHLDDVLIVPRRPGFVARLTDDAATARGLRRARFDIAIDLHGGPRGSWLTWATGAPMRIGYRATGRSWMYTHTVPRPADDRPRHAVANQWDLLGPLGIPQGTPEADPLEMPTVSAAEARVDRILGEAGMTPGGPLIVLHVSAGNRFRRWPIEHFATLVRTLSARDARRRFVLTSGPSDLPAAEAIVRLASASNASNAVAPGVVVHAQFGIEELRALATRAAVYIGGDSGPLHIAATTETPIVALFGPTLPERSMPWRAPRWFAEAVDAGPLPCRPCRQRTCAPGDFRCLTRLDPARVEAAVERAMRVGASRAGAREIPEVAVGHEVRLGWDGAHP